VHKYISVQHKIGPTPRCLKSYTHELWT